MLGHNEQLTRLALNADWIPVSVALTALCNEWAGRRDLVVYLGADGGGRSSAFYNPDTGQIEINSSDAFGGTDASTVGNLRDRLELSRFPVAGGLALHEAMHARHSTSDIGALRNAHGQRVIQLLEFLEETRVDGLGIRHFPEDAGYLRAVVRTLFLTAEPSSWTLRGSAVLLLGRSYVGSVTETDVEKFRTHLLSQPDWTEDILERLREIVMEFLFLRDSGPDLERQIELAYEVDTLLPPETTEVQDDSLDAIMEAILTALSGGVVDTYESAVEAQALADRIQREAAALQQVDHLKMADTVFRGGVEGRITPVPAQLAGARKPTGAERGAAVRLARDLERARYRDREIVDTYSDMPPGRLHTGEAMRLDATRWAGGDTSRYEPFTRRERVHVEEPTLTVGIMSDTSGSMATLQTAIGVATYVISEAVHRTADASAAQVYFGTTVAPGLRKGERLRDVRTWTGGGAYEDFDGGFRALDGELNLLGGSGARLLFVASDGQFKTGPGRNQEYLADKWLKACVDNGVAVVWLQHRSQYAYGNYRGLEVVLMDQNILDATDAIGSACIRSLASVSGL